ncbi:hypothetical protein K431DRAFT_285285 [Polychaeton citri CBS 116435]|uniref:CFEM domain-containing protein n=1 Tax=Polychaeton citri CBS 116435 TaxID=1314669 RepID=A0A9P4Q881_9PEZI|nr:hypothetical protein K431DRAFT_285285 [Polychaeton citri CBS 116435]
MKYSLSLAIAGAAIASAQIDTSSLPECGATCVQNMASIALDSTSNGGFGCTTSNLTQCACCNPDFGYGIVDCSRAVCTSDDDFNKVRQFGLDYCNGQTNSCPSTGGAAGSAFSSGSDASSTASGSGSASTGSGSGSSTSGSSASGTGALGGAGALITPVSGSSNVYQVGSETISAGGSAADEDGTTYSALTGGAGVLAVANGASTTIPASGAGSGASSGSSGSGAFGGAAAAITPVSGSPDAYQVDGSTISAGGSNVDESGTTYSALSSGAGVLAVANGASTTIPASAVGAGASSGSSGTGALGGAAAAITPVSGSSDVYQVDGSTISAGGSNVDESGTTYSALSGGAGVLAVANGASTTIPASAVGGGSGATTGSGASGLGGAAAAVTPVSGSSDVYQVDDSTISAGGSSVDENGTTYSALSGGAGVLAVANGASTTIAASALTGGAGATTGGSSTSSGASNTGGMTTSASNGGGSGATTGGAGGAGASTAGSGSGSSSSSDTGNAAPMKTAAPALIGAAAMALFAL